MRAAEFLGLVLIANAIRPLPDMVWIGCIIVFAFFGSMDVSDYNAYHSED